ncbi:MAG: synaptic vesicle VAT-1 family membrane protein [Myxococcota bacterium]|jgi:NADPH:quinone reductase-like Zn-dependent oxidoreductase
MQHIQISRPGSYDRLKLIDAPEPQPGPGEVRVAVQAIGVNYADCVIRMGLYASAKEYVGWPITPGFEVAGTIDALGPGVKDLALGDEVLAVTRFGGYATQVVAPRHQVFALPQGWSMQQAAGLPAVFLTAWYALHELAHVRPGETMLVHSAAGGVGGALVQLGKAAGARVVGVVGSEHKVPVAIALGADEVIDKSKHSLWRMAERVTPNGYDVVLDANGVSTLRQSFRHTASAGRLVVYGFHSMLPRSGGRPQWLSLAFDWLRTPRFNPLDLTNANKSVLAFNLSYLFDKREMLQRGMTELLRLAHEGAIRPPETKAYPMAEVADAHEALESGQTVGKLVLTT